MEKDTFLMKRTVFILLLVLTALPLSAQVDRREVRAGNRKFRRGDMEGAGIEYMKALEKDSTSVAAWNNSGVALQASGNFDAAAQAFERAAQVSETDKDLARSHFNEGCSALANKDYAGAVKSFRNVLLLEPDNMDAKERYAYAKKMLEDQQGGEGGDNQQGGGGGGDGQQNQDQQGQNQDQNQDQQDQNQNQQNQPDQQDQNQQDQEQPQPQQISQQQARQMLKAVQAQEKETQDKVKKEKAALLQSSQKEKNW